MSRLPAIAGRGWQGFSIGYKFVPKEFPSKGFKDLDIVPYNAGIRNKFFNRTRILRESLIITSKAESIKLLIEIKDCDL